MDKIADVFTIVLSLSKKPITTKVIAASINIEDRIGINSYSFFR